MSDSDVTIGSFPKNNREEVLVTMSRFKGYDLLGVRIWFRGEDDDLKPSKSGVTIRVNLLPQLIALLEKARDRALEKGLLSEDDLNVEIAEGEGDDADPQA